MLYFLKQAFNKHESHIRRLTSTDFSCGGFITLSPLTLMSFKASDATLKCTVAANRHLGFGSGKDNFYCIEVLKVDWHQSTKYI